MWFPFVPLCGNAAHNIGIRCGILADQKESGPDTSRFEHVEKPRGGNSMGAVIERHRDVEDHPLDRNCSSPFAAHQTVRRMALVLALKAQAAQWPIRMQ